MTSRRCLLAFTALVLLNVALPAQDEKKKEDFGEPGPEHKILAKLAGEWDAKVKAYFEPGKAPAESVGSATRKMILSGRYLQENFKCKFGEDDFSGLSIIAYDRARKKYISNWVDSMSTGITINDGSYDAETKIFTYTNDDVEPASGKKMKGRDILKLDSDDQQTFEMFRTPEGGKEFKVLEITYTKRK